jgi:signal recognition particle receptor subunit beta
LQLDFKQRELTLKLVYYGPALSGKTTNLQAIHGLVAPESRGRLMTLETKDDRTLFFDLLPLTVAASKGLQIRTKLFTVPGQVLHSATRRLVLQGADGVAFIADSQRCETHANKLAFLDLRQNLTDNGIDPAKMPLVIQFNKRDMPDVRSEAEIDEMARKGREPVFKAVALRGHGVIETLVGLFEVTWRRLEQEHQLGQKFGVDGAQLLADVRAKLGVARVAREVGR